MKGIFVITFLLMVACISTMPLDSEVVDGKGTDGPEPVTVTDTPDGEYVIPPEELAGEFEGDMVLTDEQTINLMSKTGLINTKYRWPNAVIPYVIGYEYNSADRTLILNAMIAIQKQTCIRFVERTTQVDYISIYSGTGCSSYVGRVGGKQQVSLLTTSGRPGGTCMISGIIQHELIHAIGFYHMQSSTDRDNYIRINYENLQAGTEHNFAKYAASMITNFGTAYDYNSIMHYGNKGFSRNNQYTITTLNSYYQNIIGQRVAMSVGDVARVKAMYSCR